MRLAMADTLHFVCDPLHNNVPVEGLIIISYHTYNMATTSTILDHLTVIHTYTYTYIYMHEYYTIWPT